MKIWTIGCGGSDGKSQPVWRREQTGDLTDEEHARLKIECEFWEQQVEELERIEDEGD